MATSSLILHTATGTLAFLAAIVALIPRKGGWLHRRSGQVFVIAMLLMAGSGVMIAMSMQVVLSVIGGVVTLYLVVSGWMTVARKGNKAGLVEAAALLIILFIAGLAITSGLEAANSESGLKQGFHPAQYYMFGFLALLAAAGDVRLFLIGGLTGNQRLARHLWRLCMALTIAASAFFLGQARLFPQAIRESGLLMIPVLLAFLTMVFWLIRLWWRSHRTRRQSRLSPGPGSPAPPVSPAVPATPASRDN